MAEKSPLLEQLDNLPQVGPSDLWFNEQSLMC